MSQLETPAREPQVPTVRLQIRDLLIWMAIAAFALSRNRSHFVDQSLNLQFQAGFLFLIYSGVVAAFVSLVIARWNSPMLQLSGGHALAILGVFSSFTYLWMLPDFWLKGGMWFWKFLGTRIYVGTYFLFNFNSAVVALLMLYRCKLTWAWRIVIGLQAANLLLWAVLTHSEIMTEFMPSGEDSPWHTTVLNFVVALGETPYRLLWGACVLAVLVDVWNRRYGDWVYWMGTVATLSVPLLMIATAIFG